MGTEAALYPIRQAILTPIKERNGPQELSWRWKEWAGALKQAYGPKERGGRN
jgi:hypothetical protein